MVDYVKEMNNPKSTVKVVEEIEVVDVNGSDKKGVGLMDGMYGLDRIEGVRSCSC